eukprot:TRINITY_DN10025_c0_g1_i1.p2 TRINITY_DN10025_c0_g1~~TRINITY_DN10025_c0_g1_i1.p2  ORF type:complete len:248 (+),score=30.13 TRINITY_DN10025_c0_g1_i1:251-994(+)
MAKDSSQLTPEEKKREKERLEKEKREKEELDKLKKEKEKKQKRKEAKAKKKQKEEIKRVKTLVNLPFKLLWYISTLITLLAAIVILFWVEVNLKSALIYLFFIFITCYFGIGLVMIGFVYMLSEDKKNELLEIKRKEEEIIAKEEQRKKDEEVARLQEIERDLASRKFDNGKKGELPEHESELPEDFDEVGVPMLGESAESVSEIPDFGDYGNRDDEQFFDVPKDGVSNDESGNEFYDEIFDPNFKP